MSLVNSARKAGVIGCGGAGFPTHVKLDAQVGFVIANGAECEPLLNSDQRVMEHYADELIEGVALIMENVGAHKGYIALKRSYHNAIEVLRSRLQNNSNIELFLLDNVYPVGDEQILVTEVTGKIVPEGGIPLNVDVVVSNVLTIVQVARASKGQSVTERPVTLAGEIHKPQVAAVPIGTEAGYLLDAVLPRIPRNDIAVIDGGPMMGRIVDLNSTVNKTTCGFLFLPRDHPIVTAANIPLESIIRRSVAACCQCRYCTDACSRFMQGHEIEPHLMMRGLAYETETPTDAMTAAFICSQCGLCEYACPMGLSPRRAYAELLDKFTKNGMKNPHLRIPHELHEYRKYRRIGKDRITRRYELSRYDRHDLTLSRLSEPDVVRLALHQSIGVPSKPVVQQGDSVEKGDLVAEIPDGKLGSNLHASINGTVVEVNSSFMVIKGVK